MRKNRLIALIGTLTMAAAGLVAVSAGVSSKKADSVSAAGTTKMYLDMTNFGDWASAGASFKFQSWGSSTGDVYTNATKADSSSNYYYYANADLSGASGYRFTRYSSDGSEKWNEGAWNEDSTKTYYKPNGYTSGTWYNIKTELKGGHNSWATSDYDETFTSETFNKDGLEFNLKNFSLEANDDIKIVIAGDYKGYNLFSFDSKISSYFSGSGTSNVHVVKAGYFDFYVKPIVSNIWVEGSRYSVTLNKNGGTGDDLTGYQFGSGATLPVLEKGGFTFDGWYDNDSFTGSPITSIGVTDHGNKEYWAKFSALQTAYTLNFDAGEGEGSMPSATPTASQAYTLPSRSGQIYKSKAHFDHWDDGLGHTYADGATIPANRYSVGQNVTLTANYRPYDITDGYYVEFFDAVRSPQRVKLTWNEKTGYESNHFANDVALNAGDKFKVVKYEDEQIVAGQYFGTETTDMGNHAAITEGQLYKESDSSTNIMVRVSGAYDIYFNDQYGDTANNKIWIPANSYTVIYNNNGGSGTIGNQTAYFYDSTTDTGRSFAKDVYGKDTFTAPDATKIFDGWSTNSSASSGELKPGDLPGRTTADKVPNPTSGDSVTLYAIWRNKNIQDGFYIEGTIGGTSQRIEGTYDSVNNQYVFDSIVFSEEDHFKAVHYVNEVASWAGANQLDYKDGSAAKEGQVVPGTNDDIAIATGCAGTYTVYFHDNYENNKVYIPALYTVTWKNYDNTVLDTERYAYTATASYKGQTPTKPTDATGSYTFSGWNPTPGTVLADTTYTAQFTTNYTTYTIDVDYCDGQHTDQLQLHYNDALEGKLLKPTYQHHDFGGFFTEEDGEGTQYYDEDCHALISNYTDTSVTELFAYWTDHKYQVSFNMNAPTGKTVSPASITPIYLTYGETIPTLTQPTCDGYEFDDWYVTVKGIEYPISDFTTYALDTDCTLKAHWDEVIATADVVLSVDGEDYGELDVEGDLTGLPVGTEVYVDADGMLYIGEDTIVAPFANETDADYYYTFDGWTGIPSDGELPAGDTTITATFTRHENPTITVGTCTGGSIQVTGGTSPITVPYGSTVTIVDNIVEITYEDLDVDVYFEAVATTGDPCYTYEFDKWNGISDGSITSSTTITADFTPTPVNYQLTWDFDEGTPVGSYTSGSVAYGTPITYPTTVNKTGYTFNGWDNSPTTMPAEATEITALFTANEYDVTFNANGGEFSDKATTKVVSETYDTKYQLPADPSRIGYTFAGWFTDSIAGTQVTTDTDVKITSDTTLYAHWTADAHNVTFNANGGKFSDDSSTKLVSETYDQTYALPAEPTLDGYTFAGWFTEQTGGTEVTTNTIVKVTDDSQVLYAHWTITPELEVEQFIEYFNNQMKVCDKDGKTDEGALSTAWASLFKKNGENDYDIYSDNLGTIISENAKSMLAGAKADPEGTDLQKFAFAYDYICGKYSLEDFAGRNPSVSSASRLFSVNDVSTSTWIIAATAIVGIAAVGVFFIYRKRKEN